MNTAPKNLENLDNKEDSTLENQPELSLAEMMPQYSAGEVKAMEESINNNRKRMGDTELFKKIIAPKLFPKTDTAQLEGK